MTVIHPAIYAPLLVLLVWAAVGDVLHRRIPNVISVSLIVTGLVQSFMPHGSVSPAHSGLGLLAGLGLGLLLYMIKGMGGGDVKLLIGVGAWVGGPGIILVYIVTSLVGMVIVLTQCIWHGRTRALMHNSALVALSLVSNQEGFKEADEAGRTFRSVDKPLPYAVPVLVATILVLMGLSQRWM